MMETQNQYPPPPARYKTVRRRNPSPAATQGYTVASTPQSPPRFISNAAATADSLARSRSRYRRRPQVDTTVAQVPVPTVPIPAIPREILQTTTSATRQYGATPVDYRPPKTATSSISPVSPNTSPTTNHQHVSISTSHGATTNGTATAPALNTTFQPDKTINVQVGKETLTVPVLMDTEASTLAAAVSELVPGKTLFGASILLESFKGLGLERPVRKYECIRDIMNGWEEDTKNTLILISSLSGGAGLNATDALPEPESEAGTWLYYMTKPGKWSKRWIIFREGSILLAKKETAKKEKDFQHLCHLSDFDVYDPNSITLSNVLRCPKRFCFAVKSQQKASLFQNTSDWVHYFATNDKAVYSTWQALLRAWRSYHLVYVKGYGEVPEAEEKKAQESDKEDKSPKESDTEDFTPSSKSASRPKTSDASGGSLGRKKYTPLIAPGELTRPPKTADATIRRSKSLRAPGRHGTSGSDAPPVPSPPKNREVFAPTGLLGRTYTKKVKDMQDAQKEEELKRNNAPLFTPSSAMANLSSGIPVRTNTTSHRRASSIESFAEFDLYKATHAQLLQRQKSVSKPKNPNKPLIEFSGNELAQAPQSLQRQKSVSKPKNPNKPLIEFSGNELTQVPRHQQQQRPRARTLVNNGNQGPLISSATTPMLYDAPQLPGPTTALWTKPRSRPTTRDRTDPANNPYSRPDMGNPFTGTGLLAFPHESIHKKTEQVNSFDMRNRSVFAEGSLLAKVEKEGGGYEALVGVTGGDSSDSDY